MPTPSTALAPASPSSPPSPPGPALSLPRTSKPKKYTPKELSDSEVESKYGKIAFLDDFEININGKDYDVEFPLFEFEEPNGDWGFSTLISDSKGRAVTIIDIANINIPFFIEEGKATPILGVDSDENFILPTANITNPILQILQQKLIDVIQYKKGQKVPKVEDDSRDLY